MTTAVLPTREPSSIEEIITRALERQYPSLMASQSGSHNGIIDVIHIPNETVFATSREECGSITLTCDEGTVDKVRLALRNTRFISGKDELGRDVLFANAHPLASDLGVADAIEASIRRGGRSR